MDLRGLQPGIAQHASAYGQTGSGKSVLMQHLLLARPYVVSLDTKGMLKWGAPFRVCRTFDELRTAKDTHLIYRPPYRVIRDPEAMERYYGFVYARGHTTEYTDELSEVTNGQIAPFHMRQNYQRGREFEIASWGSSQRPSMIPSWILSESSTMYVFYLKKPEDRERIEEYTGIDRDAIAALEPYEFFVAHQSTKVAQGPYRLGLSSPSLNARTA